jgi:hypothetical protein
MDGSMTIRAYNQEILGPYLILTLRLGDGFDMVGIDDADPIAKAWFVAADLTAILPVVSQTIHLLGFFGCRGASFDDIV